MPAEGGGQRLKDLEAVTDAALSYLPLEDLLQELLNRVVAILDADTAAILLLEEETRTLVARAAKGLEEEVERGVRVPLARGFAGRIAAERRPIHIEDISKAEIWNPLLREKGLVSLLGVPLLVEGQVIGVMHVGTLSRRSFGDTDVGLLQRVADRAALAIDRQLSERRRGLTAALQEALFPVPLPEFPGAKAAARYQPAQSDALGGDWYDVFPLTDGTLGVAVGDVVGHGFRAAALMGQLRAGLRAYALEGQPPADALGRLNRLLRQLDPGGSATVAYLVYDPASATAEVASAGHLPLLRVNREGAEYHELPPSVPLGTVRDRQYESVELELEDGDTLLLYTDGLVETRDAPLDEGLARLQQAADGADPDPERLCSSILSQLLSDGRRLDDVALIAFAMEPLGDPEQLRFPAEPESVPRLRRVLTRWLREHGASGDEIDRVVLAVSEAGANAVEHAYSPEERSFDVHLATNGSEAVVEVRDRGSWRPPRGENRGRGLVLMEGLLDRVEVDAGADGTTVTLACRLEGAVVG